MYRFAGSCGEPTRGVFTSSCRCSMLVLRCCCACCMVVYDPCWQVCILYLMTFGFWVLPDTGSGMLGQAQKARDSLIITSHLCAQTLLLTSVTPWYFLGQRRICHRISNCRRFQRSWQQHLSCAVHCSCSQTLLFHAQIMQSEPFNCNMTI